MTDMSRRAFSPSVLLSQRLRKNLLQNICFIILSLVVWSSAAQAFTPSQAQIEQFQSMSPSEQQALAESYGVTLPNSSGAANTSQAVKAPSTVSPRQVTSEKSKKDVRDDGNAKKNKLTLNPDTYFTLRYLGYRYDEARGYLKVRDEYIDQIQPIVQDGVQFQGSQSLKEMDPGSPVELSARCAEYKFDQFKNNLNTTSSLSSGSKSSGKNSNPFGDASRESNEYLVELRRYCENQGLIADKYATSSKQHHDEEDLPYSADIQSLQPFGYDLFAGNPSTFAPATDIPVPANYVIGPGDTIEVQLYGKENSNNQLTVNREGMVQFPEIGPVSVNGLNFNELKARIDQLVSEQMIGVKASVTMGELRSIRIFVLGEAYRPGSYTVSSLATITNALFASGGIERIGSLRNIQLKRDGEVIRTLDLYDLLIHGNTKDDQRLLPGDVIFIPPIKKTVTVTGEVRRPAIYEVKNEKNYSDIIKLAGGYTANAYPATSRVERIDNQGNKTVLTLNLKKDAASNARDGDVIDVSSVLEKLENIVTVTGYVHRPGYFSWKKGMRVRDVLKSIQDLKKNPDLSIALIKRETGETRSLTFHAFNLGQAIEGRANANLELQPRDEIMVFKAGALDRSFQAKPYTDLLHLQQQGRNQVATVFMTGALKSPGEYPLAEQMTVNQALLLAGYLTNQASAQSIFLARTNPANDALEFKYVNLTAGDGEELLLPQDEIFVLPQSVTANARKKLMEPLMDKIAAQSIYGVATPVVSIGGAVAYPGNYPLVSNGNVGELIGLAGGLKEEAYKLSAELSRVKIRTTGETYDVIHQTLELNEKGLGVPVSSRDQLLVKMVPEWGETISVSLAGEVKFPGLYPVTKGETVSQLLERAGGLTDQADAKGAIFLRESLRVKEQEMLSRLKDKIDKEAAYVAAQKTDDTGQLAQLDSVADNLKSQVAETQASGRLVFNLPAIIKHKKHAVDVILKDGDKLVIPAMIQEISILGEVNFPTSHLYEKGLNAGDYLKKSGGVTNKADTKHAYIISRDGTVRPMYRWKFLFLGMKRKMVAGDTLVVPTDLDRMHPLTVWQKTSQILFQLATTAAALNTVGAL